jgi:hypothetical protein
MADSSMGLHEAREDMTPATLDRHRGIASLMEELEAMDWYQQRIDATIDPELTAVLAHNRDEETEHAAMSLEWLRRQDLVLDEHLREYLFTEASAACGARDEPPPPRAGAHLGGRLGRDRR